MQASAHLQVGGSWAWSPIITTCRAPRVMDPDRRAPGDCTTEPRTNRGTHKLRPPPAAKSQPPPRGEWPDRRTPVGPATERSCWGTHNYGEFQPPPRRPAKSQRAPPPGEWPDMGTGWLHPRTPSPVEWERGGVGVKAEYVQEIVLVRVGCSNFFRLETYPEPNPLVGSIQ